MTSEIEILALRRIIANLHAEHASLATALASMEAERDNYKTSLDDKGIVLMDTIRERDEARKERDEKPLLVDRALRLAIQRVTAERDEARTNLGALRVMYENRCAELAEARAALEKADALADAVDNLTLPIPMDTTELLAAVVAYRAARRQKGAP